MVVDGSRPGCVRGGWSWLLQTLYLGICWSYFAYFGLYLTFATAASVIVEGATAVRHAGLPLDIGMLWLLVDLPVLFAWCVVDRRRWRWSAVAALAQFTLFAGLTVQAHRSLQWAAAERDNRYTAPALFIAELGLLPIQVVKAGAQTVPRTSIMVPKSRSPPRQLNVVTCCWCRSSHLTLAASNGRCHCWPRAFRTPSTIHVASPTTDRVAPPIATWP